MKVYLDVIFIINFLYDFLILSSVSVLLKKHTKIGKIIFGSLVGSVDLITLFYPLKAVLLLMFKVLLSVVIVLVVFGKRKFFETLFYFYIITIVIGGSQYMITGNYYEVNIITFGLISPVIIYLYIKEMKRYRLSISKYYDVIIVSNGEVFKMLGYMDTGNRLRDPIFKKSVIMVNSKFNIKYNNEFLVPYNVVGGSNILKCGSVDSVVIDGKCVDCLVSVMDKEFIKDADCLLNDYIREILND